MCAVNFNLFNMYRTVAPRTSIQCFLDCSSAALLIVDNFLVMNRSRGASSRDRLDNLDGEVSEVTSLLKDNVDKVLRRGDKLDDIQQKAGTLFLMISKLFEIFTY